MSVTRRRFDISGFLFASASGSTPFEHSGSFDHFVLR